MDQDHHADFAKSGPVIEGLSALDAEFLYLEDSQSPLHIAALCIFEGPALEKLELEQLIAAMLDRIPRYRRRLQSVPLSLGRPVWIDDPAFDVQRHVQETRVSSATPDATLCELMGELLSQPLDRTRPLWDAWLVHGLPAGQWALIARVHHSMVDGISGVDLLRVLLDETPAAHAHAPQSAERAWTPAPPPTRTDLLRFAVSRWKGDAKRAGHALVGGARDPVRAIGAGAALVAGLTRFGLRFYSRRTSSLQGPIGARRRYAYTIVSLAELKEVRKAYGCTLNDVVLCLLSGGYRALLSAQGDRIARARVRSLVPVSVRAPGASSVFDNELSAILCDLPVQTADPVERLSAITAQMNRLKHAHMVEAGAWFTHLVDLVPPLLVGSVSRKAAQLMHKHPQRIASAITTNVPGPRQPLYLLGRRLLHWYPHVPITQGARVGSACLSYAGELAFGITADHASIPELSMFVASITSELGVLLTAARAQRTGHSEEV